MTRLVTTYKPDYPEKLIDHMKSGLSFMSFGAVVDVGRQTLYDWVKAHPEFAEAKKIGTQKAFQFYEKILAAKVSGQEVKGFDPKKSDTACLIFALKTRFHEYYGEKQKVEVTGSLHNQLLGDLESESE